MRCCHKVLFSIKKEKFKKNLRKICHDALLHPSEFLHSGLSFSSEMLVLNEPSIRTWSPDTNIRPSKVPSGRSVLTCRSPRNLTFPKQFYKFCFSMFFKIYFGSAVRKS